jgi:hypothetical protein
MCAQPSSDVGPSHVKVDLRKRPDGQFDVLCTKCSQPIIVGISERGAYYSYPNLLTHRCA